MTIRLAVIARLPEGKPWQSHLLQQKKYVIASPPEAGVAISNLSVIARLPEGKPWQSHKEKISFLYIAHNDKKEIATPER
jgi:hypothetical protein